MSSYRFRSWLSLSSFSFFRLKESVSSCAVIILSSSSSIFLSKSLLRVCIWLACFSYYRLESILFWLSAFCTYLRNCSSLRAIRSLSNFTASSFSLYSLPSSPYCPSRSLNYWVCIWYSSFTAMIDLRSLCILYKSDTSCLFWCWHSWFSLSKSSIYSLLSFSCSVKFRTFWLRFSSSSVCRNSSFSESDL